MTPGLLVSVRSAEEARLLRFSNVGLIDVKEPARGPLGQADASTIAAIIEEVNGRCPVSAALGELRDSVPLPACWEKLAFIKWGLSGCAGTDWAEMLRCHAGHLGSRVVLVAYADHANAAAPAVAEVIACACELPWPAPVVLIDTFDKAPSLDGRRRTLLDCVSLEELADVSARCRSRGVRLALAGSLGRAEVRRLAPLCPDWIGVRSAACSGAERLAQIDPARVEQLLEDLARGSHS